MKREGKATSIRKISILMLAIMMIVSLTSTIYADSMGYRAVPLYIENTHTFSIDHGTLSSYSQTVPKGGASQTVSCTPEDGYVFEGVYCNGVKLSGSGFDEYGNGYIVSGSRMAVSNSQANSSYTFKTVPVKKFNLGFSIDHGTLTSYSQTIEKGKAAQAVTCTPEDGYLFEGVYCNGVKLSASGTDAYGNTFIVNGPSITITNAQADCNYTFKTALAPKEKFTIAYIANNGDTVYPSVDKADSAIVLTWDLAGAFNKEQAGLAGKELNWEVPDGKKFAYWKDINSNKQYKPGDTIELTSNTVLLAVYEDSNQNAGDQNIKNNSSDSKTSSNIPKTGDQADAAPWMALALTSMGIFVILAAFKKRLSK